MQTKDYLHGCNVVENFRLKGTGFWLGKMRYTLKLTWDSSRPAFDISYYVSTESQLFRVSFRIVWEVIFYIRKVPLRVFVNFLCFRLVLEVLDQFQAKLWASFKRLDYFALKIFFTFSSNSVKRFRFQLFHFGSQPAETVTEIENLNFDLKRLNWL